MGKAPKMTSIRAAYKTEIAKAQLGQNLANHMSYIFPIVLYDRMGMSFKKIENYYKKVVALGDRLYDQKDTEITGDVLLKYCEYKKIDVAGYVKGISLSKRLFLADIGRGARAIPGAEVNITNAFATSLCLTVPVLKECYRFSNAKIADFLDGVTHYIDLYTTKQPHCKEYYCCDEAIRQAFIEDEHWDIKEGRKAEE